MKKFETPIAEIEKFDISDIITVSVTCSTYDASCGNDTNDCPDDWE